MIITGCDLHPSWQQVAWLDTTGETAERKLVHCYGRSPSRSIGSGLRRR
jgi:hypothetical protein